MMKKAKSEITIAQSHNNGRIGLNNISSSTIHQNIKQNLYMHFQLLKRQ